MYRERNGRLYIQAVFAGRFEKEALYISFCEGMIFMKLVLPVVLLVVTAIAAVPVFAEKKSGSFTEQDKIALRKVELARLDTNKDGIVTVSDLMNSIKFKFAAIDTNNDRIADRVEIENYIKRFRAEHEGVYGKSLDNQERKLRQRLAAADQNRDGTLIFNEYWQYFLARYRLFDRNKNGIIEENEYFTDVDQYPYAN
ncbi:MAG: hypothetical protein DI626_08480 [Micavibrio aeruginosavorus]|uniref:EF-hand domain-containing protein n=1 Tax=Micavibrio aeruginosavorus TaxID=349221 RepID=A0A2W4ZPE7_9BACT|nr:MAG: hypothetical protein DI626_08480 [Micavibrio aeruginosavorus]